MKKLLFLLLLIPSLVIADETIYTGANCSDITCADVATATGHDISTISIDVRPSENWIKVMGHTSTEQADLDTLMVTTNGLTKQ